MVDTRVVYCGDNVHEEEPSLDREMVRPVHQGLAYAPRIEAVSAAQVDEAIHARGNVNVRACALLAAWNGQSIDSSLLRQSVPAALLARI